MKGPYWHTMQYAGGDKNTKLHITPDQTSNIYIAKDASSDPNNFVYDLDFLGIANSTLIIDSDELGLSDGYSVAVYVSAVNETLNTLYEGNVAIKFSESAILTFAAPMTALATLLLALSHF